MKNLFSVVLLFFSSFVFAQSDDDNASITKSKTPTPKALFDQYKVISIENDTTYIDTSLTIKKEYVFNYLRKDNFGLLPFANDGQTYNTLHFGLNEYSALPSFGFEAKQFNFLKQNQIKYYAVATPLTELYFKTTIKQGQSLDAFITLNTSERFNFSAAYKGLRSIGRYVNQLSSSGNFRFTVSYNTKNLKYFLKSHFTSQDILNGENGGIINTADFESGDKKFKDKARLQVYLTDATSLLKGNRYFVNQIYNFSNNKAENKYSLEHEFSFENKSFLYTQKTINTTLTNTNGSSTVFSRFGDSYVFGNVYDKTNNQQLYNKIALDFRSNKYGHFKVFVDDFNYNYFYNSVLVINDKEIPSVLKGRINNIGGQYFYSKGKWNGVFKYANSISKQSLSNLDAKLEYNFNDENQVSFQIQKINKLPNYIYNLYQSSFTNYNWSNDFNNEKINNIYVKAKTKFINAALQVSSLKDKLYFGENTSTSNQLLVAPKQYGKSIQYLSAKVEKEFTYRKFALDNTVLFQTTQQDDAILNVPKFVVRNTIYFSDDIFKKAMFIQTGITLNYFSSYYANHYNPVIGEFYIQNTKKIGDFPMLDLFINARVRQTRIYLKAEHFNSVFSGNKYYSAPNYPYRDYLIRFGLVWNFFQ